MSSSRQSVIRDLYGNVVTAESLPKSNAGHWTKNRRFTVVSGVRHGLITLQEACFRYRMSVEEFLGWKREFEPSPHIAR